MSENLELEAAIRAAPDDLTGYERYGRWLESQGDARAKLMLAQCAGERDRSTEVNLDGYDRQSAELSALLTTELIRATGGGIRWRRGFVHGIDLAISQQPTQELHDQLVALLTHPHLRFLREVVLGASFPSMPEVDFGWIFDVIAARCPLPLLEWVYVHGARVISYRGLARILQRPARVGSDCRITQYPGEYPRIHALDLRDELLQWPGSYWPDLERLTLRPRGNPARSVAWAAAVLADARPFPQVRELRLRERADDVLAHVVTSPLLSQLKILDCTDSITNRGAQVLYANVDQLAHLEEIWIGSERRKPRPSKQEPPPPGTREVDDGWRSRLRDCLGGRLRFQVRPGLMDL